MVLYTKVGRVVGDFLILKLFLFNSGISKASDCILVCKRSTIHKISNMPEFFPTKKGNKATNEQENDSI